jgi:GDP-mannose 6-dehydrogenase
VVVRSTILPGTSERLLIPLLESASGRSVGEGLGFAFNPEFLREGSSLADFEEPPKTVIGARDDRSHDAVSQLYSDLPAPIFRVPIAVAELAKYADNLFHALKICFANELGAAARVLGLDSHQVMNILKADMRLNISTAYLTPGFAFGGSCLPKDVRALVELANREHLDLPVLTNVLRSNEAQLQRAFELIVETGERRIGMFGLAFKSATDDLRESPFVELAERLVGKGFDLKIYDPVVAPARLIGANRRFVEQHLPHLSVLLADDPDDVVRHARVLVVGNLSPAVLSALDRSGDRKIVDLVRVPDAEERRRGGDYAGIAW